MFPMYKPVIFLYSLPCTLLRVGPHLVNPVSPVGDLGIYLDADLFGRTQVLETTASYFAALQQLQSVYTLVPAIGCL